MSLVQLCQNKNLSWSFSFSFLGYGFSDAAVRPGLHPLHIGNIFKNLMNRIGFENFYVQGGDWGSTIVTGMAAMYPDKVIGMHSNWCAVYSSLQLLKTYIGSYFPSLIGIPKDQEKYIYPMSEKFSFLMLESGYFHIQATKPDTVGKSYSLINYMINRSNQVH